MKLYHVELYGGHHETEHVMVVSESIEDAEQQAQKGKPHPYVAAECIEWVGDYEVHVVHKRKKTRQVRQDTMDAMNHAIKQYNSSLKNLKEDNK